MISFRETALNDFLVLRKINGNDLKQHRAFFGLVFNPRNLGLYETLLILSQLNFLLLWDPETTLRQTRTFKTPAGAACSSLCHFDSFTRDWLTLGITGRPAREAFLENFALLWKTNIWEETLFLFAGYYVFVCDIWSCYSHLTTKRWVIIHDW